MVNNITHPPNIIELTPTIAHRVLYFTFCKVCTTKYVIYLCQNKEIPIHILINFL